MNPNYFKQSYLQRYMQLALVIGLLILLSLPSNAQLVPFAVRSKFNTFGDNRLIGNSNITCPDTIPSTASDNYRNGTLNQDNGSFTKLMYVNIDADGTNFNSSSARLSLNPAAKVLFAGLYWFGYSNNATRTSVRFKVPAGTYQNIASTQTGTFSNNTLNNYACFADVTSIVKALASPNGDYFVGNIQASLVEGGAATNTTSPNVAGWSLIVTYYDPIETFRNLVVYDGFQHVTSGAPVSITLTKFLTPATGTFSQHLGMLVCEGDFSIAGDTVALNGTTLSDSRHLVGNFFRSAITEFNADVPTPLRNPAYINNTGPDIVDLQLAAGIVPNGTTSATFNFQSTGDVYYPLAFTFGVEGVPQISGSVFEDVNYGGGSGRSLAASSGVPIPNANVELYDSAGAFVDFQITDPTGKYYFSGLAAGSYTVRVVNSSLSSTRSGGGNGEVAVQTFRTSSIVNQVGVPDTNRVGGEAPQLTDPGSNLVAKSNLSALTTASSTPESIVSVTANLKSSSGVDFGFNFDTIVNKNDSGQGSLRQFILNSNALHGEASLVQSGNQLNLNAVSQALPAGKESSIFMASDGLAHNGLRAGLVSQLTVGVLQIAPPITLLPAVTDSNTSIDGTTQTINIGDTNSGLLGANVPVGVDLIALPQVSKPEVEISVPTTLAFGLDIEGASDWVRGIAIHGASAAGGAIISGASAASVPGLLLELNYIGTGASAFASPITNVTQGSGVSLNKADGSIQNNLIGFNGNNGIAWVTGSGGAITILHNEVRGNGAVTKTGDGIALGDPALVGTTGPIGVTENLIASNNGTGIQTEIVGTGVTTFTDNTIDSNGGGQASETAGILYLARNATSVSTNKSLATKNVVSNSKGSGIVLDYGAKLITASQNSIFKNTGVSIDFLDATGYVGGNANYGAGNGVTPNNGTKSTLLPNADMDYPIFTGATLAGTTLSMQGFVGSAASQILFAGAKIEVFKADDDLNNNGAIIFGDGKNKSHGEGRTYLGTITADANGNFNATLTVPTGVTLTSADYITATATDALGNTSEFSANCGLGGSIAGTIFEDVNYGGGSGRTLAASSGVGRPNVRVELYDTAGAFVTSVLTDVNGVYSLPCNAPGDYYVRVVNGAVLSSRAGGGGAELGVQTFRVNGVNASSVGVADPDRVGGEKPSVAGAGNGSATTVLNTTTFALTGGTVGQAQSVTKLTLAGTAATGIDFGFNFDTIVNANDTGQGSLRQFILNSNALTGNSILAQAGNRTDLTGVSQALPAGKESSIFMISDGAAHNGLRAGLTNQLTAGVAQIVIAATALPFITDNDTSIDGTTQTVNVGNTNTGLLGANIAVGVNQIALPQVPKPEVEISVSSTFAYGLDIEGGNDWIRGIAIHGGGLSNVGDGAIRVGSNGASTPGVLVELNYIGSSASAFSAPGSNAAQKYGIALRNADGTIQNNLIGFNGISGIGWLTGNGNAIAILHNELRGNGAVVSQGDGISLGDSSGVGTTGSVAVTENLIIANNAAGIQTEIGNTGRTTFTNNTIDGNGVGQPNETSGVYYLARNNSTTSTNPSLVLKNIITNSKGSGVVLDYGTKNVTISQNSIFKNTGVSIDFLDATGYVGGNANYGAGNGVTPNNGTKASPLPNADMDYPIFIGATVSGTTLSMQGFVGSAAGQTLFGGAKIEVFKADDDLNNNGAIIFGDGKNKSHGEGRTYLGTITADANGNFNTTLTVPTGVTLTSADNITATAADAAGNTSEFSANCGLGGGIAGTIFEDFNYGGGFGRNLANSQSSATASGFGNVNLANVTVELYDNLGAFVASAITDVNGVYSLPCNTSGTYTVRVASLTVKSNRTGATGSQVPVQTFRTDGSGGTITDDLNRVGGEDPTKDDAIANTTNAALSTLTSASAVAQSVTTVIVSGTAASGLDFGFNFDTIVSKRDSGQGTLRQFILNANALGDESKLAQSGNRKDIAYANQGLTASSETSIFMISDGNVHNGLRSGLTNQLSATGVAIITSPTNLPQLTSPNTNIDATTQTVNVGNTNSGTVGYSGTVGTGTDAVSGTGDEFTLAGTNRPEVEIQGSLNNILDINAINDSLRGVAVRAVSGTESATLVGVFAQNASSNFLMELNLIGTSADNFSDPGASNRLGKGFQTATTSGLTIRENLFGYIRAFGLVSASTNFLIERNRFAAVGYDIPSRAEQISYSGAGTGSILHNYLGSTNVGNIDLGGASNITVDDNTLEGAFQVNTNDSYENAAIHARAGANQITIIHNIIDSALNNGHGVMIQANGYGAAANRIKITQNSIFNNAKLGINLNPAGWNPAGTNDGVDGNDGIVSPNAGNNGMDYPIFSGVGYNGTTRILTLAGYVGKTANQGTTVPAFAVAKIEIFVSDKNAATINTTDNGEIMSGDGLSKSHGEGKTYIGFITSDSSGNFSTTLSVPVGIALSSTDYITATATDTNGNTSEFSQSIVVASPPKLLLVKRITAINGVPLPGFNSDGVIGGDGSLVEANPLWPSPNSTYLRGAVKPAQVVLPGDEVEYTIYFLNAGGSSANTVNLCDQVPTNTTFISNAYNAFSPKDTGGVGSGVDSGIALGYSPTAYAVTPTLYFTNLQLDDGGSFFDPGTTAPAASNPPLFASALPASNNISGVVCINGIGGSPLSIPNAQSGSSVFNSYGFMRFKTKIR